MTNQVSVSGEKVNEKRNPIIWANLPDSELVLNKTGDFNNIVVMSGTAKRKPLGKKEKRSVGTIPKSDFAFSKLRAPFCKPHQKHAQTEERLMTKSCEVLFECIKPYKAIRVGRKTRVKETIRTFGSILTTDVVYERKATRKVQFFSFSGENPTQSLMTNEFAVTQKPTELTEPHGSVGPLRCYVRPPGQSSVEVHGRALLAAKGKRHMDGFSVVGNDTPLRQPGLEVALQASGSCGRVFATEMKAEEPGVDDWELDQMTPNRPESKPGGRRRRTVSSEDFVTNAFPNSQ